MSNKIRLAALGSLVMTGACIWAATKTPMTSAWNELWPDPWFKVTMLDLYIGLTIMGLFMWQNKHSTLEKLIWTIAFIGLGNIGTCAYLVRFFLQKKS